MRALCRLSSRAFCAIGLLAVAMKFPSALLAPELMAQETSAATPVTPSRQLITQPVDETRLTVLKGNTHRLARPEFDQGTAPATLPMQRMLLVLKRSPQQEAALRKLLDDQQDKASPNYHKWLTPAQFGQQFGPADSDMQAITSWLQLHGFQVESTKGRTVLEFSGSASQVQEAFHTAIHKYVVNGEEHWANSSDPSIPTALTPAVAGVLTLHNFVKKPNIHVDEKRIPAKLAPGSRPQFTSSTGLHALSPEDYGIIYNYTDAEKQQSGIDGTGITITVVGRSNLFDGGADIANFRSVFGLPSNQTNIVLNGPDPGDLGGDEEAEATLDSSWSAALATGATVDLVVSATTNTTDGIDLSELYIVENNLGNVMTESFGSCEADTSSADAQGISQLAEQAAAQGISYMVSTGDTGASACDDLSENTALGPVSVNVLASTPFTVGVGGTMFNENGSAAYWNTTDDSLLGSAKSYIPEDVWNETCTTQCQEGQPPLAAGAGGASVFFPKPSWQSLSLTGMPNDGFRDLPDVSLTAAGHDPYLLCIEASCVPDAQNNISFAGIEGTSASAPSFTGIMALVDEKMGQVQPPSGARQGLPNYVLYALAATQQANTALTGLCNASDTATPPNNACVFNDVTVGNNSVPGETGYPTGSYSAGVGYDLASGLGSVNVSNLLSAWGAATFRATNTTLKLNSNTTAISIVHGQQVNVSIMVSANSGTPAGDVSLVTSTGQSVPLVVNSGQPVFTLSGGSVAAPTMQLPGGSYTVSAHYAGNGTFAPSDSAPPIAVTVTSEGSTTTVSAVDQNLNPIVGSILPFGSFVFVRADVVGQSGQGTPTGMVNFVDTFGGLPGAIFNPVSNPVALNSQGNTSIGAGVVNFDAGSHSISATYQPGPTDLSFSTSSSTQPVTFTIQPGFAGVSGPTNVTITSPGASGTSTVGFIASSNFTTAVSFTCSGLPAEASCNSTAAPGRGPNTIVNSNITVTTTAAHLTMLELRHPPYYSAAILFGSILGGGLPLAGIFLFTTPKRRRGCSTLLGLLVLELVVALPACGGGGGSSSHQQTQDPGTPAGTYTVTLIATAGSLAEQATFTLTVQ